MEERKKIKTPILILCFSVFLIATTMFWFIQMLLKPETLSSPSNLFFSATKLGMLVSGIGLIKMKKWGVYLYAIVYAVTAISFFAFPVNRNYSVQVAPALIPILYVVVTSLLAMMFYKYWKRFN